MQRKHRRAETGDAGTYIKPMLVQAAWNAIRVRGRLQARYNRLVRRFGGDKNPGAKKKAIIAIAHTLLKIAYQVLKSGTPYQDLGADFYTRRESPEHKQAWLERQLHKLHPGLHHHHHRQPAGGRLSTRRLTTSPFPAAPEPPPTLHPGHSPPGQPTPSSSLAAAQAKVRCRAPTGTRFSCQDRRHSVTNADLRRGARSPNPGAVRPADHMGGQRAAPPRLAVNSA